MRRELRQQIIHRALLHDLHFIIVQGRKGITNGSHQMRLAGQGLGEMQGIAAGRGIIQAMQGVGEPAFIKVERQIGEAARDGGVAIVDLAWLKQERIPRMATVTLTAAMELLGAAEGDPHQIAVVPVRIVGVPFKVRLDSFNPRICMLSQFKPVLHCRPPFSLSALPGLIFLSGRFVQNRRANRQIAAILSS